MLFVSEPNATGDLAQDRGKKKKTKRMKTNQPMKYVQMFHLVQMSFYPMQQRNGQQLKSVEGLPLIIAKPFPIG